MLQPRVPACGCHLLEKRCRYMKKRNSYDMQPQQPRPKDKMSPRFVIPLVLFYLVVGVLLIWLEAMVTTIASYVLSVFLAAGGGFLLYRYIRSEPRERIAGMDLAIGLILLLTGILLAFNPGDLDRIFPKIWGLSLIFGGFLKVQYAFDEETVSVQRWWIMLVFAAVSLVIGTLALMSPAIFGENRNVVIGIFMLGEAVLDIVTYFLLTRGLRRHDAEKEAARLASAAAAKIPAAPAAPAAPEAPAAAPGSAPQEE